ncbi:hypothetical protein LCGC14_1234850 [marine sediment metagenome]|uniref:Phage head-tail adaptor n=1 Tax=marine sediment metagenome TaxID=412755 RepID=A0A0F9LBP6_9ZZZZ
MRAGKLRHRVTIEVLSSSQDAAGQETGAWSTFASRWASVQPLTGKELFSARQFHADITHRVRMWYLSGVVPKMRIAFDSRLFNIIYVRNADERNKELEILCVEEV